MTKSHLAVAILSLALFYPALQAGKWLANRVWTATMETIREQASGMTLVLGQAIHVANDAGPLMVLGTDICPGQQGSTMRALFGETANAGKHECIVVTPSTTKVMVTVFAKGEPNEVEQWTVERDGHRISFRRPNGVLVIAAAD